MQTFWADSDSLGKINDKKIFKNFFFQCLALPKDPQSIWQYIKKEKKISSKLKKKKNLLYSNYARISHKIFFQKNPIGSG